MSRIRFVVLLCLVAALLGPAVSAQAQTGDLRGAVTDDDGVALPGVTVTLSGQGARRVTVTNAQGEFRFLGLAPGAVRLSAELEGFEKADRAGITVEANRTTTLGVQLRLAVEDELVVTSVRPLIADAATASASQGGPSSASPGDPDNFVSTLLTTPGALGEFARVANPSDPRRLSADPGISRRDYFDGALPDTTIFDPTAPYVPRYREEFLGGVEFEVARSVSLDRYIPRSTPPIFDFSLDDPALGGDLFNAQPDPTFVSPSFDWRPLVPRLRGTFDAGPPPTPLPSTLPSPFGDPSSYLDSMDVGPGFFAVGPSAPINVRVGGAPGSDDFQVFMADFVNERTASTGDGSATTPPQGRLGPAQPWFARALHRARDWLALFTHRSDTPTDASVALSRAASVLAPGTLVRVTQASAAVPPPPAGLVASVVATGQSSGEAFVLEVLTPTGETAQIVAPDGLVLQAVRRGAATALRASADETRHRMAMTGFCLQFHKPPPPADTIYQVAPESLQQRYAPMRAVLRAGRALADAGGLHPDSNPLAYATSIRQWALWTRIENWNLERFTREFEARSRKNADGAGVRWTNQMRDVVRAAAPNRFDDILAVLREADRLVQAK